MKWLHAIAFQGVWFACVLGAAAGSRWVGLASVAVFLALTLASSPRPRAEGVFVIQVALLGGLLESILSAGGVLSFAAPGGTPPGGLAPLWLVALWAAFGTLAPRSLSWLQGRSALACGLGALAGPLTYFSAVRLGAAELAWPLPQAALAVGAEYALALPLVVALSRSATLADPVEEASE